MTCFLFPGQGSQKPGMGQDFYEQSQEARAVLDTAAAVLPAGFLDTLFGEDAEAVNHTRFAQPALLAVETAIVAHLSARGVEPSICMGHSLGEISALVAAKVCAFEDALGFVQERARLMSEDVPPGGMAAVMGLDPAAIAAALPDGVQIANDNGPGQTIISGSEAGLAAAAEPLKAAGAKRVLPLKVSGPFHSVYMKPAAERFAAVLAGVHFSAPACTFVSSVTAQPESDPERIRTLLAEQLYSPVRWSETIRHATEPCYETGPGSVLAGLSKRIEGAPPATGVGTVEAAGAVVVDPFP
ncbi:MAG: ACP S-malonyltransferase [Candidatus Hydrogenedens sp.]|nr:ACP S-malonyltransferase [Candidatus Hydrogenedens sp.]